MARVARIWALLLSCLLAACASVRVASTPVYFGHAQRERPLQLRGIGACSEAPSRAIALHPERPLVILVHGAHASGEGFPMLADAFAAGGQQAICFRYDSRVSVSENARLLRDATATLARELRDPHILLFGHSQGGLVARAALSTADERPLPSADYRLVTVSSPFAGIRIAAHCGNIPYHIISLGVSLAVCRAISGGSWNQIHPRASMVRDPAALDPAVREHLEIVTDERDTCRRYSADGLHCLQDDFVFSLHEQHNEVVERDQRVIAAALSAGHVEVVGAHGAPRKLIEALQEHGMLAPDLNERATLFEEQSAKSGW